MSFSPPLLFGATIQFQSQAQLDWFNAQEMSESRLTVISDGGTKLFEEVSLTVRLVNQEIGTMRVMAVHHNADLLGLQILQQTVSGLVSGPSSAKTQPDSKAENQIEASSHTSQLITKTELPPSTHGSVLEEISPHPRTQKRGAVARAVVASTPSNTKGTGQTEQGDYGGLLLERYGDADYQGFAVTPDDANVEKAVNAESSATVESTSTKPIQSNDELIEDGEFRTANLFFPLDKSSLIGFLVHVQSRCLTGELMLKSKELLLTVYTDEQGQLCLTEETLVSIEQMGEHRSYGHQAKQSQHQRIKDAVTECIITLSRTENVHFRFVPGSKNAQAERLLPFTVYCCQVLQSLLKGSRLDAFKSYYEARSTYFVNHNQDAPIKAQDFGLDRKHARFFELVENEEHDMRMLLKVSPASNGETYRLLRMGELLELIRFTQQKLTEVDLSEDHLNLLKQHFTRSQQGHFDALGAHMVAHPKTYPSVFQALSETFSPDSEYASHSFRHRELCAQIVRLAKEGLDYLSQRRLRVAYRQQLFDKTMLRQAADVLLEKADMNRLRGDQVRMREALEMALELDPILTRQHVQNQKAEAALKPDDVT